jgi:enoyl-CoA hydratase/carnithine racemase
VPTLTEARDGVQVINLGGDENRFTPQWISEVNSLLDQIERLPRPVALVTHATGKFWSNGIDLDGMPPVGPEADAFVRDVHVLLARFVTSPFYSVAAVQGHAFAAGAMLTLAHDSRIMRRDRGFWCLPEIDIGIPFTTGMATLIGTKLTPSAAHEAMSTGRRYGAADATAKGIIEAAVDDALLLDTAIGLAAAQADRAGPTLGSIKGVMYSTVIQSLRDEPAPFAVSESA